MGEAIYHLRARWPDEKSAAAALPKVRKFMTDVAKAYEDWQNNRGFNVRKSRKVPPDFYKTTFQKRHGKVLDKLGIVIKEPEKDPSMNQLAGVLESPVRLPVKGEVDACALENSPERCVELKGATIYIHGEVWHLGSWDHIAAALEKHFGAIKSAWISEEYGNVGDLFDV